MKVVVHKRSTREAPRLSMILLDWTCRERFWALDWLERQNVPRDQYELLWVELHDRVVPKARQQCDALITLSQEGLYHKHVGYNVGLLHAKGEIVTVCDSDAEFPPNFVESVLQAFPPRESGPPPSLVLMHYEYRSPQQHPGPLSDISELSNYEWADLWPNVGACMSVLRRDAIRYGGFDEHSSYRGYMCGPYDLGWRMINAGIPERWHDPEDAALWHFAHPDPVATYSQPFSLKLWREAATPHINGHALTAVDAFSTGRILPLQENPELHRLRMDLRQVGTLFEERYAWLAYPDGFGRRARLKGRMGFYVEPVKRLYRGLRRRAGRLVRSLAGIEQPD